MGLDDQHHPSLYLPEIVQESVQVCLEFGVLFLVVCAFNLLPQDGHEKRLLFYIQLQLIALVLILGAVAEDRFGYQYDLGQEVIFQVIIVQKCFLLVVYEDLKRTLH